MQLALTFDLCQKRFPCKMNTGKIHSKHRIQDEIDILQLSLFKHEDRGRECFACFGGLFLNWTRIHTRSQSGYSWGAQWHLILYLRMGLSDAASKKKKISRSLGSILKQLTLKLFHFKLLQRWCAPKCFWSCTLNAILDIIKI